MMGRVEGFSVLIMKFLHQTLLILIFTLFLLSIHESNWIVVAGARQVNSTTLITRTRSPLRGSAGIVATKQSSSIQEIFSTSVSNSNQSNSVPLSSSTPSLPQSVPTLPAKVTPVVETPSATSSTAEAVTKSQLTSSSTPSPISSSKSPSLSKENITVSSTTSPPLIPTSLKPELNPINTKISLYTRKNPTVGHILLPGEILTVETAGNYRSELPVRVIIHGSFDGVDFGHWMRDMKTRMLEVEDSNVIAVDWSASAGKNNANQRVYNARIVGHQVARVLEDFIEMRGMKAEDVHIIAHGDGTFAADVAGQRIKGIGRITGLNPSGPNFDQLPPDQRLDRTDALFVDVIHTDDQNDAISPYKRGTSMAIGDVDFYPNGGKEQPGCSIEDLDDLFRKMISEGLRTFLSCSHYRAVDYFIESISDSSKCLHMGYECKSYEDFQRGICGHCHDETNLCSEMGFRSIQYFNQMIKKSRNEPIKLFYSTSRQKPYCLYHYNVQVSIAQEPNQIRGGLLNMRIEGEKDSMDVKIYGGSESFKAGYTTGLIATHTKDLGAIKYISLNWVPNTIMTLLYGENLYVEDVRIAAIGWDDNKLKTDEVTTLCPVQKLGLVTPFYGDTPFYKSDNCTFQFNSEKTSAANIEKQNVQNRFKLY